MRLIHAEGISDHEIRASVEIAKVVRKIKFQAIQIPENSSLLWDYKGLESLFCALDWDTIQIRLLQSVEVLESAQIVKMLFRMR